MKSINKIKRLVKNQCASYFPQQGAVNHYCCMVDWVCLFHRDIDKTRCKYFEQCVLPLDEDLEWEYRKEHELTGGICSQAKPKIKCKRCSEYIEAKSNRQQYCDGCKKINDREKSKLRMSKKRQKGYDVTI